MPHTIDRSDEQTEFETLFDTAFINSVKQNIGFDPETPEDALPISVSDLVFDVVSIIEQEQWRFIIPKPITLILPYEAFMEPDGFLFLPYGPAATITEFDYIDVDGDTVSVDSADYTKYAGEPIRLWSDEWQTLLTNIDSDKPYPVTITYSPGYSSFSEIPRATLRAIKILAYHMFEYRDAASESMMHELPQGFRQQCGLNMLNSHRSLRYLTDDWRKVSR
jgi:hypothetical protein